MSKKLPAPVFGDPGVYICSGCRRVRYYFQIAIYPDDKIYCLTGPNNLGGECYKNHDKVWAEEITDLNPPEEIIDLDP